jgi:acyl carrier protein
VFVAVARQRNPEAVQAVPVGQTSRISGTSTDGGVNANLKGRGVVKIRESPFYTRVARIVADALGVDEDDVIPSATLLGDLHGESIDLLDVIFRLERDFAIKIPRGELFPDSIFEAHPEIVWVGRTTNRDMVEPRSGMPYADLFLKGNPEFVREGRVTDRGMVVLRSWMPYADLADFERDRRLSALADLFTVGLVVRYVEWKLGRGDRTVTGDRADTVVGRSSQAIDVPSRRVDDR